VKREYIQGDHRGGGKARGTEKEENYPSKREKKLKVRNFGGIREGKRGKGGELDRTIRGRKSYLEQNVLLSLLVFRQQERWVFKKQNIPGMPRGEKKKTHITSRGRLT